MIGSRKMIGIVDDDPSVLKALGRMIQLAGFDVSTFGSPVSFLSEKAVEKCDLLILDVRMPGINGLELQDRLASSGYDLPVIFITAHESSDQRQKVLEDGAVAFLKKPFDEQDLLGAIDRGLKTKNPLTV